MSALQIHEQTAVPELSARTLTLALTLAYQSGRAHQARADQERLQMIDRTIERMLRSIRRARPTPREGIVAGLLLLQAAARGRAA